MYRYTTKQQYKINRGKSFLLGGLMGLATLFGCEEPDNPTPPTPQPDPTDTIVIPTKEKVFDMDLAFEWAPSADSIKKYADNPEYKYIFINVMNKGSPSLLSDGQEGMPCSGYPARVFKRARDTLQTRIDINPAKVRGSGTIIVNRENGAQLPDSVDVAGMWLKDSIWFANMGYKIERIR